MPRNWRIPPADAVAHIEVDIRSLFDGSVRHVSEDVPFLVTGHISGAARRQRVDRRRRARIRTERMPLSRLIVTPRLPVPP